MSMLNTSHLRRSSAAAAAGLIYEINFNRETKTYYPGEILSGKIIFLTTTRAPVQGLKTRLIGIEEISWGVNFIAYTKTFLSLDYYAPHNLNSESGEDYEYEFKFTLPMTGLPQSFEGPYGSVRYYVETVLSPERSGVSGLDEFCQTRFFEQFRGYFTMRTISDLNSIPDLQNPAYLLKDNSGGLSSFFRKNRHPIRFTFKVSKRGFVPTEGVHFTVVINNGSSKTIQSTTLKLIQETRFTAGQISRDDIKTVHRITGPTLEPKSLKTWEDVLFIPGNIPISASSHSISIYYKLRVTLTTSGFHERVKGDLSIEIGTIPIDSLDPSSEALQPRSNSFTSSREGNPRVRFRNSPVNSLDLSHRHSISSLPTYNSVQFRRQRQVSRESDDGGNEHNEPSPPSYTEAIGPESP